MLNFFGSSCFSASISKKNGLHQFFTSTDRFVILSLRLSFRVLLHKMCIRDRSDTELFHNASVFSFRKEYHDVFFQKTFTPSPPSCAPSSDGLRRFRKGDGGFHRERKALRRGDHFSAVRFSACHRRRSPRSPHAAFPGRRKPLI